MAELSPRRVSVQPGTFLSCPNSQTSSHPLQLILGSVEGSLNTFVDGS